MPALAHGASAYWFADIDADRTLDFFYGDLFSLGIFFMKNVGTPTAPHIQCTTNRYPAEGPVLTSGFNVPLLVDIDGDGDLDLFDGVLGGIVQRHGFWFLENVGDSATASFVLRTKDYLSMIDVGMNAHPALVDIDHDNDLDLIVGNLNGQLWLYRNDGAASAPSFVLVDTLLGAISGGFTYAPAFVDIDGDGDQDLFVGQFNGHVKFYRNIGSMTVPQFIAQISPVDSINVSQNASPAFVDIDGDRDYDLFIGKGNGQMSFYRNIGDSTNFIPQLVTVNYGGITVSQDAEPTFVDVERDGDYDLFIGNADGTIDFYENIGTRIDPQFVRRTNHFANTDPMKESVPAFGDIDGDGDLDLFVGTSKGGLHFYRNNLSSTDVGIEMSPPSFSLNQNYPNPFNPTTTIPFEIPQSAFVSLKLFNLYGQNVATLVNGVLTPGRHDVSWNAVDFPSGVYYYRLTAGDFHSSRKMLIVK